ncbi:MAG: GSU2204 family outer membrane beta-barrel protein, partial [Thermodesulfobacteriota bacterium]|nr:GSU2204 family outer membrane beta-barrel protein [Thermodesulfobacteriota bacterium]
MKRSQLWLLALLSVLTLMVTTTVAMANEDGAHMSGSLELGVSGVNTDDNARRVNEYGSVRAEEGISLAPKLNLEFISDTSMVEITSDTMGPRDQHHSFEIDASRIFKFGSDYSVMQHHYDHDNINHIGATVLGDIFGNQPRVTSPATIGNPEVSTIYGPTVDYGVNQPVTDAI